MEILEAGRGAETLRADADRAASRASLVSVGVLSFHAPQTISRALQALGKSGLIECAGEFFVYFNAITGEDVEIADEACVRYEGSPENRGIYGGFRAIAEIAKNPYVLILENDIVPAPGSSAPRCVESCVADMIEHDIKVFSLKSRLHPGQGAPGAKYMKTFGVSEPLLPGLAPRKTGALDRLRMFLEHGGIDKFRSAAILCEREPEKAQPGAVRRLPSGNYLTDSRYRTWGNQAVLVERRFFLDVVCRRVEEHPDPRLVNGHQDIERALNRRWWRRQRYPMGHAAQGAFTHWRLDR
jgi:hypothetical protein